MAEPVAKKTRTRSGCLTCRDRHLKCDEQTPVCTNCVTLNRTCVRGARLNFIQYRFEPVRHDVLRFPVVGYLDELVAVARYYEGGVDRYKPYLKYHSREDLERAIADIAEATGELVPGRVPLAGTLVRAGRAKKKPPASSDSLLLDFNLDIHDYSLNPSLELELFTVPPRSLVYSDFNQAISDNQAMMQGAAQYQTSCARLPQSTASSANPGLVEARLQLVSKAQSTARASTTRMLFTLELLPEPLDDCPEVEAMLRAYTVEFLPLKALFMGSAAWNQIVLLYALLDPDVLCAVLACGGCVLLQRNHAWDVGPDDPLANPSSLVVRQQTERFFRRAWEAQQDLYTELKETGLVNLTFFRQGQRYKQTVEKVVLILELLLEAALHHCPMPITASPPQDPDLFMGIRTLSLVALQFRVLNSVYNAFQLDRHHVKKSRSGSRQHPLSQPLGMSTVLLHDKDLVVLEMCFLSVVNMDFMYLTLHGCAMVFNPMIFSLSSQEQVGPTLLDELWLRLQVVFAAKVRYLQVSMKSLRKASLAVTDMTPLHFSPQETQMYVAEFAQLRLELYRLESMLPISFSPLLVLANVRGKQSPFFTASAASSEASRLLPFFEFCFLNMVHLRVHVFHHAAYLLVERFRHLFDFSFFYSQELPQSRPFPHDIALPCVKWCEQVYGANRVYDAKTYGAEWTPLQTTLMARRLVLFVLFGKSADWDKAVVEAQFWFLSWVYRLALLFLPPADIDWLQDNGLPVLI